MKQSYNNIITLKSRIALLGAILFSCLLNAQESVKVDSLTTLYSFGFDGSKVFNQLFRANAYSSTLFFEYRLNPQHALRLACDVESVSGSEGKVDYQLKAGYKYTLKENEKWLFYVGLDGLYEFEFNRNSKVEVYREGGLAYIGATTFFGKHFSLTTEPSFYLVFRQSHDKDSFDKSWKKNHQLGLTNIGLVRISYHF
tara:strand:- start:14 stop:607 length:594 start_codon:yes stop_codon:yes gene_type:complete